MIFLIHFGGIRSEEVLLGVGGMHKGLDMLIKRGFVKIKWHNGFLLLVQGYVLEQIFPSNQGEAKLRQIFIERKMQILPHLPQKPIKHNSERLGVA